MKILVIIGITTSNDKITRITEDITLNQEILINKVIKIMNDRELLIGSDEYQNWPWDYVDVYEDQLSYDELDAFDNFIPVATGEYEELYDIIEINIYEVNNKVKLWKK